MRRLLCNITGHGLNQRRTPATPATAANLSRSLAPSKGVGARLIVKRNLTGTYPKAAEAARKLQLRPYQEESIQAVLEHLAKGERRLGLSLATGSGKTVIFSHLIERVPAPTPDATQTLILAHRRELVEQAAMHCRHLYPDKIVEIEMGKQHASGLADITVASEASIMSGKRIMHYDPERFKLVLVDEAHHIVAPRYLDILRHFNLVDTETLPHTALVGVSATLARHDGLSLGTAIDHIVYHKDYIDMIEDDWLANVIFTTVRTGIDLSKVKSGVKGDFQTDSLSKVVNNDDTNTVTVRAWLAKAQGRNSTLVFCIDIAHVTALTSRFRQHGVDARFITGDTDGKLRAERLAAFKAGEFPVLLNVGILTEGTDIPNLDCIVLARPTKSRGLLVQMIGRGLRKHAGKQNCHVIDLVASLETGIVTTPTLFGLDPHELVEETDAAQMKSLRERKEREKLRDEQTSAISDRLADHLPSLSGNVTFTDYENVNDLIEDTSGERHIRAISRFSWVQIDPARYILSSSSGDFLSLRKVNTKYIVTYNQKMPSQARVRSPFMRPRQIAETTSFESGVHAADRFAKENFPFAFIAKNAAWRQYPATDGQITFLNRFRDDGEKLQQGDVTKGKAGDWITKIKHGARGRFDRLLREKRKVSKINDKKQEFEEMQKRAQVRVGPVKA